MTQAVDEGRIQKLLVKDLDLEDGGEYKMSKGQIVSKAIINVKGKLLLLLLSSSPKR